MFAWLLALCLAAGPAAAPALAQSSNVAPSVTGAELAQIQSVRRALFQRMMADPANLDIAFEYATLSAQAGDLEGAISTLERMLVFAPGLARLQFEIGILYYRLGSYQTAASYLEAAAAAPDTPTEMRAAVSTYLTAIERRASPSGFEGSVFFGARYQSNANAAPASRLVTLNGTDFLLGEEASKSADVNAFASASLRYSRDLERQGDRFEMGLNAYGAAYAELDELNTAIAELTAGPVYNLARFHLRDAEFGVYGILGGVLLGSEPYLGSAGVGASLSKGLGPSTRAVARGEYRRERFEDTQDQPTASLHTGDRFRGSLAVHRRVTQHIGAFVRLRGDIRNADVDYLSLYEAGAAIGAIVDFRSPIAAQDSIWSVLLQGGYVHRSFDAPDPVIDPYQAARDNEVFVEATLSIPLSELWSMHATGGYRDNDSNYDTRSFENFSATLGLMRRF